MAREASPAFQFYPKEFLTDGNVAGMSLQERGAYITLLCICWQEGSLPASVDRLANMVGVPLKVFTKFWPAVSVCFTETEGRLAHGRLDKEREKQAEYRRRQTDNGRRGGRPVKPTGFENETHSEPTTKPNLTHTKALLSPISDLLKEREKSASLSPAARLVDPRRDPFNDPEVTARAGLFVERYEALYQQHRRGARYAVKPARDYAASVTLCTTWPDDRLDKLAVIFLTTDHKFAEEGSRTIPQFLALASWCDGRLAEHQAKKGTAA